MEQKNSFDFPVVLFFFIGDREMDGIESFVLLYSNEKKSSLPSGVVETTELNK